MCSRDLALSLFLSEPRTANVSIAGALALRWLGMASVRSRWRTIMKRSHSILFGLIGLLGIATASAAGCNATGGSRTFGGGGEGGDDGSGNGSGNGTQQSSSTTDGVGGSFAGVGGSGSGGGTGSNCQTDFNVDDDGDGLTEAAGDCNDCDANVSPGSIEVLKDPNDPMAQDSDEDCDGTIDNLPPASCDDNLALDNAEPQNGARAIDLCQFTTPADKTWGVLDAKYVRANGQNAAYGPNIGILSNFGPNVNPQGGTRVLGLSSGHARLPSQAGSCGMLTCYTTGAGTAPNGFPQDVPSCPGETEINDDIGLDVRIRSPRNATGYKFNFKFYSFEYPEWLCMSYNDQFIALVTPPPMGSINGNISFDKMTNPVSVNVAFFDVCPGCPLGTGELSGTGFDSWDDAGGTGWLATQAPIKGGEEFSIRFAIWDTGDQAWDSTALVDGFQWIANGGTVAVGTEPIPDPK